MKTFWTDERKRELAEAYPREDTKTLADRFGVTEQAIKNQCWRLGICSKNVRGPKLPPVEIQGDVRVVGVDSRWNKIVEVVYPCGHTRTGRAGNLRRSPACTECNGPRRSRNGLSDTPEYHAWRGMKRRCLVEADKKYPIYGGRGITVCARWRESFDAFLADMGPRPSDKHSIDRIDVNGNYEPSNCRWATASVQQRNKRTGTIMITARGRTQSIHEWVEETGLSLDKIRYRLLRLQWSQEEAVAVKPDASSGSRCETE